LKNSEENIEFQIPLRDICMLIMGIQIL